MPAHDDNPTGENDMGPEAAGTGPARSDPTGSDPTGSDPAGRPATPGGVAEPAKLMRILDLTRQMLEELRLDGLDLPARERAHSGQREALHQLRSLLSEDNQRELDDLLAPLESAATPSGTELRLHEAQLLGWLEGLLKGIETDEAVRQMQAEGQQTTFRREVRSPQEPGSRGGGRGRRRGDRGHRSDETLGYR